ncbi:helix-turn-helix domain-containing protein [Streptosporangium sp. NPDC023825]|uniref:helix-turn-helix domain-containing protein n=1 Tax=Streptosporangium sp. NPDC023825 TaxID=3154909 RepID=UPI00341AAC90
MEFQIPDDPDHRLYDVAEAAAFLRMDKDWLYDLCQAKKISHLKRGRRTFFFHYHLVDYLKRGEVLAEV